MSCLRLLIWVYLYKKLVCTSILEFYYVNVSHTLINTSNFAAESCLIENCISQSVVYIHDNCLYFISQSYPATNVVKYVIKPAEILSQGHVILE